MSVTTPPSTAEVSQHFISPLNKVLKNHPVSLEQVFQEANVSLSILTSPYDFCSLADLIALWHTAISLTGDPLLAIKAGQLVHPSDYGLIGALSMNCNTIGEALETMTRYRYLFNGGFGSKIFLEGHHACYEVIQPNGITLEQAQPLIELDFSAGITMAKFISDHLYDDILTPAYISLQTQPLTDPEQYEKVMGCPIQFEQSRNCLFGNVASLSIGVHLPNPILKDSIIRQIEIIQKERESQSSYSAQVEQLIEKTLPDCPNIDEAAKTLCTSKRTLKRRLHEEGKSYSGILDTIRKHHAIRALNENTLPISEIAFRLGFSSTSTFHRAFKRWTGKTPSTYTSL